MVRTPLDVQSSHNHTSVANADRIRVDRRFRRFEARTSAVCNGLVASGSTAAAEVKEEEKATNMVKNEEESTVTTDNGAGFEADWGL